MRVIKTLSDLKSNASVIRDRLYAESDKESESRFHFWNTLSELAYEAEVRKQIPRVERFEYDVSRINTLMVQIATLLDFGELSNWLEEETILITPNIAAFIRENKISCSGLEN